MAPLIIRKQNAVLTADPEAGCIRSFTLGGAELVTHPVPLFTLRLRGENGEITLLDAFGAKECKAEDNAFVYLFPEDGIAVRIGWKAYPEVSSLAELSVKVENENKTLAPEWLLFPTFALPALSGNGGSGEMLVPYNEGAIIRDIGKKMNVIPEYPSHGSYFMFPNMVSSQFMAYLRDGNGLYIGAHDPDRAPKGVDVGPDPDGSGFLTLLRLFCGCDSGEEFAPAYPIVLDVFEGGWESAAELYRTWLYGNLPVGAKKVRDNPALPEWYDDMPLIVTYPVRGWFDMDKMDPNDLFPYKNALPWIDEIAEKTGCRILVLLMHWEGTAPWAPPYVWPPYGGEEALRDFIDTLHKEGNLLGVYCSGFGFTMQSNLIAEYNNEARYKAEGLSAAMCASPENKPEISRICTGQRSGYDICVGSDLGKKILNEAYQPLFESGIDYAQILDQNHGGGQYFCYSKDHGHPRTPGKWMTEEMKVLLTGWNERAPGKLFGCESAAGEPFFPNLLFSDNRYELNWGPGYPVPLYGYLYHEYLHNFMGNQVSCHLAWDKDTLCCRMAYSFTAGDCLAMILRPDGELFPEWGCRDFSVIPDKARAIRFAANLRTLFNNGAAPFLRWGKMLPAAPVVCASSPFKTKYGDTVNIPDVLSTAWEVDGARMQLLVNHTDNDAEVTVGGKTYRVPALGGIMIER